MSKEINGKGRDIVWSFCEVVNLFDELWKVVNKGCVVGIFVSIVGGFLIIVIVMIVGVVLFLLLLGMGVGFIGVGVNLVVSYMEVFVNLV